MRTQSHQQLFDQWKCCVLIPTYNNAQSIGQVITDVLAFTRNVIVVNDGSTDGSPELLRTFSQLEVLSYQPNKGKGHALQRGFERARELGYDYAITLDADGQHYADDLPVFLEALAEKPGRLLIGARNMDQEHVPGGSSFGNRFSNFWFWLETGISLPDTQSGYRLYPLRSLAGIRFFSSKYEFEIEVIVRAAWKGIEVAPVPVKVYYPPKEERISHFRPFWDFFRISVLNTFLVLIALLYIKPRDLFRHIKKKPLRQHLHELFLDERESKLRKALAVSLGVFMGIVPIWGWQLVSAIGLAYLFRLNRPIVILAANISLPPMIPFIVAGSYLLGGWLMGQPIAIALDPDTITLELIWVNFQQYLLGSLALAVAAAVFFGLLTLGLLNLLGRR
ncbi:MAG: DUF2062 domain-containing protein [Bacteroidetes bacterium]|nr:MAG: DUF2062 domain-containing protein [Bacteroidota bacterium]